MLELEAGRARFFKGTWHAWRKEKAARELALGRAIERQQEEIERLERFVTRFRAGTRARQAQSRAKKLDKMERVTRDPRDGKGLGFAFKPPERSGRVVFEMEDARCGSASASCCATPSCGSSAASTSRSIGPNGSGKTTLIDGARRRARARRRASCAPATTSSSACLSQHAEELDATATVLEAAQRATRLTPNKARALLGQFLFSGEAAEKPVDGPLAAASGGGCRSRSSSTRAPTC